MMKKTTGRSVKALVMTLAVVGLSACSGTRDMLGLDRQAPDEFAVYSRAPLSLPPEFSLKPPTPGQARPQGENETQKAQQALLGNRVGAPAVGTPAQGYQGMSPGLQRILQQTGALSADPEIRQKVNRETSVFIEATDTWRRDIMFWKKDEPFGTKIDAEPESQRIREAQALGEDVTGDNAYVIEQGEQALFEGLLN